MLLRTLEQITNVCIIHDDKTKVIRLYGLEDKCSKAVEHIKQYIKDTENEVVETVSLSSETKKNALLKAVIKKYGTNLDHFIEVCNLRSAVLDIRGCQLFLHGGRDSIEEAINCIKDLSNEPDIDIGDALSTQEICPVCACVAINTYRLEYCHHLYCRECIQGWIEQAPFPIHCCAEGCHKDILLYDIKNILGAEVKVKGLLEKSVKDYLDKNHSNISNCPAPDCPMFFYKDMVASGKHTCPLCRNEICLNCNVIYHHGYTCEMYTQSKLDPDYSFKVWQKTTTQCKRCPNCQAAVEKSSGCNHMTCKCGAHFCWICVRLFRSGNEVYDHIHTAHRGNLFT
ncbi:ATP-dependent RNA helicase DEAH12, chloroplastic-like isoform X1 [Stegodyphus dumicola]|uniref:ATP-dependent RNA helicase DEAH12, chloroplastic-like isoform X1 n=1 Tax=Stegodyphus dumicola TaxID=202533 RepID=UPI0015AA717D|nr:ATP-dependent RNA helicase DEAH12, chloroplastic-like isoform X1 [Stegodyphus dumicola]